MPRLGVAVGWAWSPGVQRCVGHPRVSRVNTADPRLPPPTRVPGVVVVREFVAHTENAAVMLLEAHGYSQGFLLDFMAVGRPGSAGGSPVLGIDFGSGVLLPGDDPSPPDGGRAVHRLAEEEAKGVDRGARGLRVRLWVTPLPPAEGFTVVTDWPRYRIVGQRGHVGGEAIRIAAWESFPCLPA